MPAVSKDTSGMKLSWVCKITVCNVGAGPRARPLPLPLVAAIQSGIAAYLLLKDPVAASSLWMSQSDSDPGVSSADYGRAGAAA